MERGIHVIQFAKGRLAKYKRGNSSPLTRHFVHLYSDLPEFEMFINGNVWDITMYYRSNILLFT